MIVRRLDGSGNKMIQAKVKKALAEIAGSGARFDEPLSQHTSMRVGGPVGALVDVDNEDKLKRLLSACRDIGVPLMVIGGGTNMIVGDGGWSGVMVRLTGRRFRQIEARGRRIVAGGAAALASVVEESVRASLTGLEELAGMPGTVGGAIRMNSGAHGVSIGDRINGVCLMETDGSVRVVSGAGMGFEYRGCRALGDRIVLGVVIQLAPGKPGEAKNKYARYLRERAAWVPRVASAGSIFKNPGKGRTAGELIDGLDMKGSRCGGAMVYRRHANVIVNRGDASGGDVLKLMRRIKERVREARGIELEPEVIVVGEDGKC